MKKSLKVILIFTLVFALSAKMLNNFVVHAAADKTQLISEYNLVQTVIQTQDGSAEPYYETASYAAFLNGINNLGGTVYIQSVIDDGNVLQTDVDILAQSLNSDLNGLVLDDTYYTTLANYSDIKAISLTGYTQASILLYNSELDRIKAILDNPTSGETAVEALNADLAIVPDLLVLLADKTEMNSLINQINTIYAFDESNYIPSTFLIFQTSFDNIDTTLNTDIGMTLQQAIDDADLGQPTADTVVTDLNNVLGNLVLKPDKTQLETDYNTAYNKDLSTYTSSSTTLFQSGLISIKSVIDNVEATQSDVDQAATDLVNLYNLLVLKADITTLESEYNAAVTMDVSEYTPNSVIEFNSELTAINQVIKSNDTDQSEADQALTDLRAMYNLLVLKADKSILDDKNDEAIVVYYEEKDTYTLNSYNNFKAAVNDYGNYLYVNTVLQDENVSQDTVNQLVETITSAISLLVDKADNTNLLTKYNSLNDLNLDGYTSSSKTAFQEELDRLFTIINSNNLDQSLADQALTDLNNAQDLLVQLPDFTELQTLIDNAKVYREEDYSISSYNALQIAIGYAQNVIADDDASQKEVDDMIQTLTDSINNLSAREGILYISQGQQMDISNYVTLGDTTVKQYSTSNPNIISVDEKGIITAQKYGASQITIELANGVIEQLNFKVKASVSSTTIALSIALPFVGIGVGSTILFTNKDTWTGLLNTIKNIKLKKK